MYSFKNEIYNSIRYIIPILFTFVCALIFKNFNDILAFFNTNIATLNSVLSPFIIGFIIAYIANQPMKALEDRFKIKRGLSIAIVYGVLMCVLVFAWIFIMPVIKSNITDICNSLPKAIEQIQVFLNSAYDNIKLDMYGPDIKDQVGKFISDVLLPMSTATANIMSDVLINGTSVVVNYIVNIFLGLVISVYLLLSKEKALLIVRVVSKKVLGNKYKKVREFFRVLDKNIGVYLTAKAMDSMIYGVICTIVLSLIGSKYALLLGIVAAILNMIPFFGPIIATVIVFIVNIFFSFKKAVISLIVMIAIQQLESAILEPFFVGKQVGVHPIFTILAVTFASKYTGLVGILLSVPVAGVLLLYADRYLRKEEEYLKNI